MNKLQHRLVLNPLFLISLVILIINDHFLKVNYPGWVTGKLSDFSGLIVFAIFLVAISGGLKQLKLRSAIIHIATAILFVVWKLADLTPMLESLHYDYGFPLFARVADTTDLIALSVLPFSHYYITAQKNIKSLRLRWSMVNRLATCLVLVVAGVSIMATSKALDPELFCCDGMRGDINYDGTFDISDLLFLGDYLYKNGRPPVCIIAADIDGSGGRIPVTEDDIEYLINFMFKNGPPPKPCPGLN